MTPSPYRERTTRSPCGEERATNLGGVKSGAAHGWVRGVWAERWPKNGRVKSEPAQYYLQERWLTAHPVGKKADPCFRGRRARGKKADPCFFYKRRRLKFIFMSPQAKYWVLTIPHAYYVPYKPPGVQWIRGQLEQGESGYLHWQLALELERKRRLSFVRGLFGQFHCEQSRSAAVDDYVWKEDTRVDGTQFELGQKTLQRNSCKDWKVIKGMAVSGRLNEIDEDVYIRYYGNLKRIAVDNAQPVGIEREVQVWWGKTGVGKSRRAWELAGMDAYPKDPNTKFWDGYRDHENVVIDEFRGRIDVSHLLRWFDRYPVLVEIKGSAAVLKAKRIFITSNIAPWKWYPDLDPATYAALERRLVVHECQEPLPPM